jgi:hypothetical protein
VARPGQQQRGRCARAARSDDHDVVLGCSHGMKLCAGRPRRTWRSGGEPVETDARSGTRNRHLIVMTPRVAPTTLNA